MKVLWKCVKYEWKPFVWRHNERCYWKIWIILSGFNNEWIYAIFVDQVFTLCSVSIFTYKKIFMYFISLTNLYKFHKQHLIQIDLSLKTFCISLHTRLLRNNAPSFLNWFCNLNSNWKSFNFIIRDSRAKLWIAQFVLTQWPQNVKA